MNQKFTVKVDETDDGELAIPLPDELLTQMNWTVGDKLMWKDNKDGSFSLTKKIEDDSYEKELVLVETISTFVIRYVVEVPKGETDWALDTVTMEEAREVSQKHISESIAYHRVISKEEYLKIFDADNDYQKLFREDEKLSYITKINKEGDIVD